MGIIISKKKNQLSHPNKKIAVVTILGTIDKDKNKAHYIPDPKLKSQLLSGDFSNMFPLLLKSFKRDSKYEIIPIYTTQAKQIQNEVLKNENIEFEIQGRVIEENAYMEIFNTINIILQDSSYESFIVDVSHGFRHLPILATVSMIINNFEDTSKIKHILFSKEIERFKKYQIIDLKEYLDMANIAFVLSTFEKNYTVATHIHSTKYNELIDKLNAFSNDLMALSLNNLFTSSAKELIAQLENIDDTSIESQAKKLSQSIKKLTNYKGKKRYETYLDMAKDLVQKNYLLLGLSLLYESIRLYIKSYIKKRNQQVVEKIENVFKGDSYKIGDLFIRFKDHKFSYTKYKEHLEKNKKVDKDSWLLDEELYKKIKRDFPNEFRSKNNRSITDAVAHTRNNLAHANSDNKKFKDIKKQIEEYIKTYELCIK